MTGSISGVFPRHLTKWSKARKIGVKITKFVYILN